MIVLHVDMEVIIYTMALQVVHHVLVDIPVLLFQKHQCSAVRDIILLVMPLLVRLVLQEHIQVLQAQLVVLVAPRVHIALRQFRVLFLVKLVIIALVLPQCVQHVLQVSAYYIFNEL